MTRRNPTKLTNVKVNIKAPFLNIQGSWEADKSEQLASWELYVELVTRISTQGLKPEEGLLREAIDSLYQLVQEIRVILKKYGPGIAQPKGKGRWSFGSISVTVLNFVIRPLLAKWHPLLLVYENTRDPSMPPAEHETKWEYEKDLRTELSNLQETLRQYSFLLAEAAGIPPIES